VMKLLCPEPSLPHRKSWTTSTQTQACAQSQSLMQLLCYGAIAASQQILHHISTHKLVHKVQV